MNRHWSIRILSLAACSLSLTTFGLLLSTVPASAQSGLVLTGSEGVPVLNYKLDFNGVHDKIDRYRLDIPAQDVAVAEVQIGGDKNYNGVIDPESVRLEVEGKPVELSKVYWNAEFRSLEVIAKQPIAAGQSMKLILSNVRNPSNVGVYRFSARLLGTEANPLFRTVGNWLISIDQREKP